ncbi:MAG: 30S ribosomal protein S4 [Simkaniaceae bacterium]
MARYTGPKNRIARRFGANVFGRWRNPLLHKPNPPGVHGAKRKKKSDYGLQLEEKQKLRAVYGMLSQKQLVRYYKEALRRKGNPAHNLLEQLESRLDNIVYRLKIGSTIFQAQQLVSHGHILINGKKVDIRSFQVKPGMKISIKEKSKNLHFLKQNQDQISREIPEYLSWDPAKMEGELLTKPGFEQVSLPLPINVPLVCEFLAHTTA